MRDGRRTLRVSDRDNSIREYDQDQTKTPDAGSLDPLVERSRYAAVKTGLLRLRI